MFLLSTHSMTGAVAEDAHTAVKKTDYVPLLMELTSLKEQTVEKEGKNGILFFTQNGQEKPHSQVTPNRLHMGVLKNCVSGKRNSNH